MEATVSAWNALVLQFVSVFTRPTAETWRQVVLGWVLAGGPAAVTRMIRTLGGGARKHWTVYHKFFYRARWRLDALCVCLLQNVIRPLIVQAGRRDAATGRWAVDLNLDDTTAARRGRHVAHAGWFKDASATGSGTKGTVIHWAHNWIVGVVTVRLPGWGLLRWALPVAFALYRKRRDCGPAHPFRNRQTLAGQMVRRVAEALPDVQIRVAADGAYATRDLVAALPEGVDLVSRIRRDAAVYALPPRRKPGQRGRPAKKGRRLPTPAEMAQRRRAGWRTVTLCKQGRRVRREVLSVVCLWYHVCRERPIRLVFVRDPSGKQRDDFFFCTNAAVPARQIVQRYLDRWGVEEAIQESKQHLGFERTRGWCSKTVNRQAPLAMVLTSLVKAWYAQCALRDPALLPTAPPWYPTKTSVSLADMLSALRRALWLHRFSAKSRLRIQLQQILEPLSHALSAA